MTVDTLARLITQRITARAQQEPNPMAFRAEVLARLLRITDSDGLIALGGDLGILAPELNTKLWS